MPKELHDKLVRQAKKKGIKDKDRLNAYVYSVLNKVEKGKKKKH